MISLYTALARPGVDFGVTTWDNKCMTCMYCHQDDTTDNLVESIEQRKYKSRIYTYFYYRHAACVLARSKAWREANRDRYNELMRGYARKNPQKRAARDKANHFLPDTEPCEVCGTTENIHRHHADYGKPLEVKWLCRTCHSARHREMRQAGRQMSLV